MIYKIFRRWIPLAFLATAACGLVYVSVQQSLRQGANDPQIQMAEDAAAKLKAGIAPQNVVPSGTIVSVRDSLAPYLVIYAPTNVGPGDALPIAGDAIMPDFASPALPTGVFAYVAAHGEDRLTWQPAPGIRQAIVVVSIKSADPSGFNGFVMAGRSLREVENREDQALVQSVAVWIFSLFGLLVLEIIFAVTRKK